VHTYRIPGLATTNKGSLIGVYDIRRDKGRDLPGNIDVGMSRSTDGGRTWEPMQVIMDMGDDPKWNGDGIGDPSILVDRNTGTIWVSATWSHGNRSWHGSGPGLKPEETGQWMMVKSDDDGLTWSDPINITRQVKNPNWSFLLQGPGKGITMSDGTLVFPAQYQDPPNADDKTAHRLPHSTIIYSKDHGNSWQVGTGAFDDTTESQVVELSDGRLMLNCRYNRESRRVIMTTDDMGKTWQKHSTHVKALIEPRACMASQINVGRELAWRKLAGESNELLLFSNPESLNGRNHVTIKASPDSGATWPATHHLLLDEQTGAGYSCLSMIDKETVGILYEGSQAQMTFQRIKLADILKPPSNQKTKNPAVAYLQPPAKKTNGLLLARPFGDHMVLQANQPIRVWGTAKPAEEVTVKFSDEATSHKTDADQNGEWQIELPARPASESPVTLIVSSTNAEISIRDVLIGEVWFCAGQSNMQWPLVKSEGGEDAILTTADRLLRLHNCPPGAGGKSGLYTQDEAKRLWPGTFTSGQWKVSSPASAAPFSAVGYYFAKRLREELRVPVGVINVSVGGTPIESWVSQSRLSAKPSLSPLFDGNWLNNSMLDDWCRSRAKANLRDAFNGTLHVPSDEFGPNHPFKPGFMFRAGVEPFLPMSIRGGLWYQGESNADTAQRISVYNQCFPLFVQEWRSGFKNEAMPIGFVQLPAMRRPNWPQFREQQRRSLSKLSNIGMAITIDTGHPTDVHPKDKKTVGDRLAKWALVDVYGKSGASSGPLFSVVTIDDSLAEVTFRHVGSGLRTRDGNAPLHFEIAGADGKFHKAEARINNHKVQVSSPDVPRPVNVRYAWAAFPDPSPNLINSDGLPASPFTTEDNFEDPE
jgi:hypothetical protein